LTYYDKKVENERQRLFAAFPVMAAKRRELAAQGSHICGRPVPLENLHVTLFFFGNRWSKDELIPLLEQVPVPAGEVVFRRLQAFGHAAALAGEADEALRQYEQALAEILQKQGIRQEKRSWQPHVTLVRNIRLPLKERETAPVVLPVIECGLYASLPVKGGVRYRCLWVRKADGSGGLLGP
jgi:2'-5' RNA ligase